MTKKNKSIVFCDSENKEFDPDYALRLHQAFRDLTGWLVAKDTRIWNDLNKFSMGYSKQKREPLEVAAIFKIAAGI